MNNVLINISRSAKALTGAIAESCELLEDTAKSGRTLVNVGTAAAVQGMLSDSSKAIAVNDLANNPFLKAALEAKKKDQQ
ncbi:hypothetical protein [Vibrio fluvialis]|uniref:hypothetical protein n=1 Tax=Vibrio fluvialis TaxID=676 RepID=UPI0028F6F720|nr:hypothetical protein [Vibrio fluvialis]